MLRRLYDFTLSLSRHPNAKWALGLVSFAESSFFPIPPDIMLIPMVIAERAKAWAYATICTITSVLGGIAGYAIGAFLLYAIGALILDVFDPNWKFDQPGHPEFNQASFDAEHPQSTWGRFKALYQEWGFWIVFAAGFSPIPYKIFTIASGAVGMALPIFVVASLISRGARFFLVSALLYWFGPPIREFIEKRLGLVTLLFVIGLVGGFLVLKLLH